MDSKNELEKRIDDDLKYCKTNYEKYPYDATVLEDIFNRLLFGYIDVIDGLSSGLNVVSPGADTEPLRDNVKLLMERIEAFKQCGCSNDALRAKYMEMRADPFETRMKFCAVREAVLEAESLNDRDKDEINSKIDDIEEICMSVDTKRGKWNRLRPYVVWTAGKSADIALMIMPLFLTIG